MRPAFDMDALRTLVVGTELGSFARAASKLGRSQSAISMQLKKLEQQAGQPLLRRSGRGLVPTEAGDALLTYARRIVALNDEAAASLDATAAAASVRIGLPQDFVRRRAARRYHAILASTAGCSCRGARRSELRPWGGCRSGPPRCCDCFFSIRFRHPRDQDRIPANAVVWCSRIL